MGTGEVCNGLECSPDFGLTSGFLPKLCSAAGASVLPRHAKSKRDQLVLQTLGAGLTRKDIAQTH